MLPAHTERVVAEHNQQYRMMSEVNKVRWREMNEMNFATKK
jgi:hypothetical protein